ncbi:MAG: enolase C-terminal domain-like protein [Pseudomonadota bacterium]
MNSLNPTSPVTKSKPLIKRVELVQFRYPVTNAARDPRTGKLFYKVGAEAEMPTFAIRLESDNVVGEYVAHMGGRPAVSAQVATVAKGIVGMPIGSNTVFNAFASKQLQTLGQLGVGALDIAMWDLLGKSLNTPISDMIGLWRAKLPTYASLIHGHRQGDIASHEALKDAADHCVEVGFRGVKFRGWPGDDAKGYSQAIEALAMHLPDRKALNLFLDPGCDLTTFGEAIQVGHAADEAGLYWLEDVFRDSGHSRAAHQRLRQQIKTPLLCGEHVRGLEAKADWVSSGATDFIRADPELDGGISGCLKIAHLAEAFGMDMEVHGSGPAHRLTMAAIRNTNFYEFGLVMPDGTNIHAPPVYKCGYSDNFEGLGKDGTVCVPSGPGLGVRYDWAKIRKMATDQIEFT